LILKEVAHRYVPKELLDRPKKGFSVPIGDWMKGELRELLREKLEHLVLSKFLPITGEDIWHVFDNHMNETENNHVKLWVLLMLQLWIDKNETFINVK